MGGIHEPEEETGLAEADIEFVPGFKEAIKWFYSWQNARRFKTATYFLAEAKEKEIKISEEHLEYKWLGFEQALEQLTYDNAKSVLEKADKFLRRQPTLKSF